MQEAMASPTSAVLEHPPMSGVRISLSSSTLQAASSMRSASSASPSHSSISFADRIEAIGLAMPLPAMSNAVPCIGSKNPNLLPMHADGAMPRPPIWPMTIPDRMSP